MSAAKRKKPRNKAYRPKQTNPLAAFQALDALHFAAEDRRPMHADHTTDLALAYRLSFQELLAGHGTEEHWSVCVCSLNVAVVLAEWGFGSEYISRINEALEGAFRSKMRATRTGTWRFDGPAIQSIKDAYAIHDEQILLASKKTMRDALLEVRRRVSLGNVFREAA